MLKKWKEFNESTAYHTLNDGDDYDIVKVTTDDYHTYKRSDGILYELSNSGNNVVAYISQIEHTIENTFYTDQIDRYIQYLNDGGIIESFPVTESNLADAYNLADMLEYVEENIFDNDMNELYNELNKKFIDDIIGGIVIYDLTSGECVNGIDGGILNSIKTITDLNTGYNNIDYQKEYEDTDYTEDDELRYNSSNSPIYYTPEYHDGFKSILEYWEENKSYILSDMNHRFAAVKGLGKSMVYVDISQ